MIFAFFFTATTNLHWTPSLLPVLILSLFAFPHLQLLHCIAKLYRLPVSVQHLQETGIGRTVNGLRKFDGEVGVAAKALVSKWKSMVAAEESEDGGGGEQQSGGNNHYDQQQDEDDEDDEGKRGRTMSVRV